MRQQIELSFGRMVAAAAIALLMGLTLSVAAASADTYYTTPSATAAKLPCSLTAPCTLSFAVEAADENVAAANTVVLASGNYSPMSLLDLTNPKGVTIQGPTPTPNVITPQADVSGNQIQPAFGTVVQIEAGVTASFENVVVSSAGGGATAFPAINDLGTLDATGLTAQGNNGAISIGPGGSATLTNSTVADAINTGIIDNGTLTLVNSDVIHSGAGGIANSGATLKLVNSIVALNQLSVSTAKDCFAPATSSVTSIDGDGSCSVGALSKAKLNLTTLDASPTNGGSTPTYAPGSGSPAIGGATGAQCPTTDQRGYVRPATGCDIGAVQTAKVTPVFTTQDVTAKTPNAGGTTVSFMPTWTDSSSPVRSMCQTPTGTQSGATESDTFPIGTTTVNCTGKDAFGNKGAGSFNVTVKMVSNAPPVISISAIPDPVPAQTANGANVTFTTTVTDANDGTNQDAVNCAPASGTLFAITTTPVTCTSTDSVGNVGTKTFNVTVKDVTPPTIQPIGDVTQPATGPSGAVVTYSATATDNVDGTAAVTCTDSSGPAPSGTTFPVGTTKVTCSASDKAGNPAAPVSFNVIVTDLTAPVIAPISDISAAATGPGGAAVTYTASATDLVDGSITPSCTPASGSTFAIGTTKVTCTAKDSHNNAATPVTFTITVTDIPVLTASGTMGTATGPSGGVVSYTNVQASAPVVGGFALGTCTPKSGSTFPVGTSTVMCSFTDAYYTGPHGSGTASFTVTVIDTAKPVVSVPAAMTVQAANASGAVVNYSATASDLVDGAITPSCSPPSGSTFPVGTTPVNCTVTDKAGLTGSASFTVTVTAPPATSTTSTSSATTSSSSGVTTNNTTTTTTSTSGVLGTTSHVPANVGTVTIRSAKSKGSSETVDIACGGARSKHCKVLVELVQSGKGRHPTVFAERSITLSGGKQETVTLRLNGAGIAAIRKHKGVELVISETAGKTTTRQVPLK